MVLSTNRSHPIRSVQILISPIISWNAPHPHPHLMSITDIKQQSWQLFTEQRITTDYYFILIALAHFLHRRNEKTQICRHNDLHTYTQTQTLTHRYTYTHTQYFLLPYHHFTDQILTLFLRKQKPIDAISTISQLFWRVSTSLDGDISTWSQLWCCQRPIVKVDCVTWEPS